MPPLDDEIMSSFLTPKKVGEICDKLLHSSDPDARMVGMHIKDSLPADYLEDAGINLPIEIAAAAAPGPKRVLDSAVRHATKGGKTVPPKTFSDHFQNTKNWGLALLQEYFFELRKKICGKGKKAAVLGQAANAALAALGTTVAKFLGLTSSLGMGIAVLIITNAAWIGKIALCKMTSPEQLARYFG